MQSRLHVKTVFLRDGLCVCLGWLDDHGNTLCLVHSKCGWWKGTRLFCRCGVVVDYDEGGGGGGGGVVVVAATDDLVGPPGVVHADALMSLVDKTLCRLVPLSPCVHASQMLNSTTARNRTHGTR